MIDPAAAKLKYQKQQPHIAFNWDQFGRNVKDGNFGFERRFFREDGDIRISRLEVTMPDKKFKTELLLPADVTEATTKTALEYSAIDAALVKDNEAKLVRTLDNKLYFDINMEKAAPFAKALIEKGFAVRPLILQGQGSFNIPKTGPQ